MKFKDKIKFFINEPLKSLNRLYYKLFYLSQGFNFWNQLKENVVTKGKNIVIGKGSEIYQFVVLKATEGYIKIGNNVSIHSFCFLTGVGGLEIGDNCRISNSCCFIPFNHKYKDKNILIREQGLKHIGIKIEDDCWIGSNCSILAGTKLRKGCVVGAGSVVNKEFPPYSIIAGVPAKIIGKRE